MLRLQRYEGTKLLKSSCGATFVILASEDGIGAG
jgi:hypothetical protein